MTLNNGDAVQKPRIPWARLRCHHGAPLQEMTDASGVQVFFTGAVMPGWQAGNQGTFDIRIYSPYCRQGWQARPAHAAGMRPAGGCRELHFP